MPRESIWLDEARLGVRDQNSFRLPLHVIADVAAGALAGAAVSPVVSAIDRALAENASGTARLWPSFFSSIKSYISHPMAYLRGPQFFYIWLVYGGTYIVANLTLTACSENHIDESGPKWVTTTATNTSFSILKDRAFARLFGDVSAASALSKTRLPPGSYAAWISRDVISMGFFFTLPPIAGKKLAEYTGDEKRSYQIAQITLPLILQTVTSPIHLLGYEIHNNRNASIQDRMRFLRKDYFKNVSIRMLRMAPPWSFGTVGNTEIRSSILNLFGVSHQKIRTPVYHHSG